MTMNRAEIRQRILEHADMVGSQFVQTPELNAQIDASIRDLYAVLVRTFGDEAYAKSEWINCGPAQNLGADNQDPAVAWPKLGTALLPTSYGGYRLSTQLTADGGVVSKYTLPDDFLRLLRVHFVLGRVEKTAVVTTDDGAQYGPEWRLVPSNQDGLMLPIRPFDLANDRITTMPHRWEQGSVRYRLHRGPHRIVFGSSIGGGAATGTPSQYINNTAIDFLPVPSEQAAVQIFYVPRPLLPQNDTDDCDYGYPDWIVHDVAAYCLEKQRSDSSLQRALMERVRNQIIAEHQTVDAGNPPMVRMADEPYGYPGMPVWPIP